MTKHSSVWLVAVQLLVGGAAAACPEGQDVCDEELTTLLQTVARTEKDSLVAKAPGDETMDPVSDYDICCYGWKDNYNFGTWEGYFSGNSYSCRDQCFAESRCRAVLYVDDDSGRCGWSTNCDEERPCPDKWSNMVQWVKMIEGDPNAHGNGGNGGNTGGVPDTGYDFGGDGGNGGLNGNDGSASGDPHLVNLRGEKFDLNVAGRHTLLQIPKGSGKFLEVSGHVEHLPTEVLGHAPCDEFLFTEFSVRGSWVDSRGGEVTIKAGKDLDLAGFSAHHTWRGDTTSTSYKHMMTRKGSAVVGKAHLWGCKSNEKSLDQKQLCKQLGSLVGAGHRQLKFFDHQKAMFVMSMEGFNTMPVHLGFFRFEGASPAYLNMAFNGLHHTDDVGGLLGSDDHSEVARQVKKCNTTHHAKLRPDAQRHAQDQKKVRSTSK